MVQNEVKASLLRQLLGRGSTCDMGDLLDRVREDDHECEEDSDADDDTQPPGGNSMKSRSRKFAGFDFATPDTLRPSITTEAFLDSHESGQHPSSSGPTATEKASLDLSDPGACAHDAPTYSHSSMHADSIHASDTWCITVDVCTCLQGSCLCLPSAPKASPKMPLTPRPVRHTHPTS